VKRVVRHQRVDGHTVAIVEVMEEEGPSFVLVTDDGSIINPDQPLPTLPDEATARELFRRWRESR